MTRRQFLPVAIGATPHRIFIEDLLKVHKRVKKARPRLPKYRDDAQHEKQETIECWATYESYEHSPINS